MLKYVEDDPEVRIRNGHVYLEGVAYDHLVDVEDRTYTVATPLRDTPELRRVIALALRAGRRFYPARLPLVAVTAPN